MIFTDEQLSKFRTEFEGTMMYSAIWEYCPPEFGLLLDEVTTLRTQLAEARAERDYLSQELKTTRAMYKSTTAELLEARARIEKLEKVREAAWNKEKSGHDSSCPKYNGMDFCACGYEELYAALKACEEKEPT